jgi:hypothetical protein
MATELGGSVFEITHDLIGDLFRAKNAGVTAGHGFLHALDLLRGCDLGLQSSLAGCSNLCVGIGRLPQQTCLSLSSFGKRLQQKQTKTDLRPYKDDRD